MFCPKCGHENDNNNGFCMNCGAKFNIDEAMRSELEAQERNGSMPEPKRDIFAEIKGWISGNKKKFIILTSTIGGAIVLTGTFLVLFFTHVMCFHDWQDATCTEPKTCSICYRTEGEPLGHNMSVATCTEDAKCKRCGYIAEKALGHKPNKGSCTEDSVCTVCGAVVEKAPGHKWKDADCENPKTCEICGETEGEPTGHKWKDATCTEPKTCEVCGKTEGDSLGHDWLDATYSAPMTCSRCGKTKGEKLTLPDTSGYLGQGNNSHKIDKPKIRSFVYPYQKGEINCKSDIVPGYSTSYIVDGGGMSKECESLGDTWHVTAQNYCCTKGTVWYELWDTDDGDYYGWVDSEHIKFYW